MPKQRNLLRISFPWRNLLILNNESMSNGKITMDFDIKFSFKLLLVQIRILFPVLRLISLNICTLSLKENKTSGKILIKIILFLCFAFQRFQPEISVEEQFSTCAFVYKCKNLKNGVISHCLNGRIFFTCPKIILSYIKCSIPLGCFYH